MTRRVLGTDGLGNVTVNRRPDSIIAWGGRVQHLPSIGELLSCASKCFSPPPGGNPFENHRRLLETFNLRTMTSVVQATPDIRRLHRCFFTLLPAGNLQFGCQPGWERLPFRKKARDITSQEHPLF